MATYPNLPDNRLIVNGVDLSEVYGLILIDGYNLKPPEPKTYTVDIPGGNGIIDLSEALTGDIVYENRSQKFTFDLIYPENFEKIKTRVMNFLHGKAFDYKMTMDPDYTYHGRFKVTEHNHTAYTDGILGVIVVEIDANPYKRKERCVYSLNAGGGRLYKFESGRRKVHPIVECTQPCYITWNHIDYVVPQGTYRLNDVLFSEGTNEMWVNTCKYWDVTWEELAENGALAQTWENLSTYRWDEIQTIGQKKDDCVQTWLDLGLTYWGDLLEKHWYDLNYKKNEMSEVTAYISYDWEDL